MAFHRGFFSVSIEKVDAISYLSLFFPHTPVRKDVHAGTVLDSPRDSTYGRPARILRSDELRKKLDDETDNVMSFSFKLV